MKISKRKITKEEDENEDYMEVEIAKNSFQRISV